MKKFKVNNVSCTEEMMARTNYCPVLIKGETDSPIVNSWNEERLTSKHSVKKLSKNEAVLDVKVAKEGEDIATVKVIFNTRDGKIRDDMTITLKSNDFSDTVVWIKRIKTIRKYIIGLIRKFAELNNEEYKIAQVRPEPAVADAKPVTRAYEYTVNEFERKGYYRTSRKTGEIYYVRATTCHPNTN